ncbi:Acg family FMN-binding oxidoreductase [Streptococcus dentasini]
MIGRPVNSAAASLSLPGVAPEIEQALYDASFAANSHNTQAWEVSLNPKKGKLSIAIDDSRTLSIVDPHNRELYISLGAYIQSLKTTFKAYGYDIEADYASPLSKSNCQVVTIYYQKSKGKRINQDKIDLIRKRHTDKRPYQSAAITQEHINQLQKKYPDIAYYAKGTTPFDYIKKNSIAAARKQHKNKNFLQEQGEWLRFSNQETQTKLDGISADMMGLNMVTKSLYYLTSNHRNATSKTFAKQSLDTLSKQVNHSAGFFVITGRQTISDWIQAGEKAQAFWYDCTENDIAIQPISAMIEVSSYEKAMKKRLHLSQDAQMILRAGRVKDYGKNKGLRRSLKDYITVTKQ